MGAQLLPAPAGAVVAESAWGASSSDGSASTWARADHGHGTLTDPRGLPLGLTGATAASRWMGATSGGAPSSGTFSAGDWVVDNLWGILWQCTAGGSPGTWRSIGTGRLWGRARHSTGQTINAGPGQFTSLYFSAMWDPANMVSNSGGINASISPPFTGYYKITLSIFINPNPGSGGCHDFRLYLSTSTGTNPDTITGLAGSVNGGIPNVSYWEMKHTDTRLLSAGTAYYPVILNNNNAGAVSTFVDSRCSTLEWQYIGNGN